MMKRDHTHFLHQQVLLKIKKNKLMSKNIQEPILAADYVNIRKSLTSEYSKFFLG